jgi:hypothetical protein
VWLQASESVLSSGLSGEVLWVAFAPVGEVPIECDVVPKLAEDLFGLLASLCLKLIVDVSLVGVTNYMWSRLVIRSCALYSSSGVTNYMWDTAGFW